VLLVEDDAIRMIDLYWAINELPEDRVGAGPAACDAGS